MSEINVIRNTGGRDNPRWRNRPTPSTWGDFGADDTRGRLNLITSEKVREGFEEVTEYKTFALGLPLDLPGGNELNANRLPLVHRPNLRAGQPNVNAHLNRTTPGATDVLNDDLVMLHTQYSTQWDALVHAGALFDANADGVAEAVYYNGFRAEVEVNGPTAPADCGLVAPEGRPLETTANFGPLGIHSMATYPVQGRAVLVDLAKHFGTESRLIGWDEFFAVLKKDRLDVRPGDILLIHTGFAAKLIEMNGDPDPNKLHNYGAVLNGRDAQLLKWITDSQVAAIAADNNAVEQYPAVAVDGPAAILPLHEHCIFKLGVHLGELWYLTDLANYLADEKRTACLITAPPLHLPGASGSPLNPVATV